MAEAREDIAQVLFQSAVAEWLTTLSLVFGGCCSNAWALELATSQNPHAGTLITFAQFLLVSLYGLCKHLTVAPGPLSRKDILRLVTSKILDLHSKTPKDSYRQVYVAIEGPSSAASLFTEELAKEVKSSSSRLSVQIFCLPSDDKRVTHAGTGTVPDEDDYVELVYGSHLHTTGLRDSWDYSIFLKQSPDSSLEIPPSPGLLASSLAVDITTPSHPIIIFPRPITRITPWNFFNTLPRIRLKERSIPIARWAIQVALFLLTSLLNNAAFGYNVPMAVHIIFRSGGLVVNMIMGWLIDGRKYNATQIISVIVVTLGVVCTTLSASQPSSGRVFTSKTTSTRSYFVGILILTLALVMSGFMGLAQDRTYAQYGRGHWQEAMFYLHFLALPGFAFMWSDLGSQVRTVNASAKTEVGLETLVMPFQTLVNAASVNSSVARSLTSNIAGSLPAWRLSIPSFYFPLLLNVATQLFCVSGVHRLTSRVNALTVSLVLVVRKAVSLGISVVVLKTGRGGGAWLWTGAALVLAGTIGYTVGGNQSQSRKTVEGAKGRNLKED